ncbi:MAG: bifunctional DNA-formamidopyrimidine glycosylase/DNA-(apurinic or apyrimidinic site) lyase [Myxococcales bacterium]|nr:bifunctional DNA-formamidopyrimidine glycosylase/DNA-(apurinic or apyrimidinic site) lyase [Myxococcales bacterium]MCB9750291.1 bifunctional DNA-formamidopyrimidine glycosylase/DNA-(apurinic or apyrimidinic site) lyase [Myxococcales bacterium]
MPELPEVESVRRGLVAARVREPVTALWRSEHPLRIGEHWREENLDVLVGARPGAVRRRGKHIIWEFTGPTRLALLIHLGMTGRCGVAKAGAPRARHTHLALRFADDRELRFVDPRRFGGLRAGALASLNASPPLSTLGVEPLDPGFDGAALRERLGASKRAIRDALLDQTAVAGVGNIYAVEALFIARIHPLARAVRLRATAWDRLAAALVRVLEQGIENGGTTLKDFRNVVGEVGRNQDDLAVYGRAGQPCPSCGQALESFTHGGRSGVLCPVDQARPRGGWIR